jgi:hypothetical protein
MYAAIVIIMSVVIWLQ